MLFDCRRLFPGRHANDLAEEFKLRSVRIRSDTKKSTGYLWHFGHFIHDLIMPLNDWLVSTGRDPKQVRLFIEDSPDQSVGSFLPLVTSLSGVSAKLLKPVRFRRLRARTLTLEGYLFGPYSPESFDNIQAMIDRLFDLSPLYEKPPEVILIERSVSKHGFEEDHSLREYIRESGIGRRHIVNHEDLCCYLARRFGNRFLNVVLEDMPIADQVRLFHHAKLVIGQHGAGLNNLIWMKNPGMVLELTPSNIETFQNMCLAKGLAFRTAGPFDARHTTIEPNLLAPVLDEYEYMYTD